LVKFVENEHVYIKEKKLKLNTEVQLILMQLLTQFQNDCTQNAIRESE